MKESNVKKMMKTFDKERRSDKKREAFPDGDLSDGDFGLLLREILVHGLRLFHLAKLLALLDSWVYVSIRLGGQSESV